MAGGGGWLQRTSSLPPSSSSSSAGSPSAAPLSSSSSSSSASSVGSKPSGSRAHRMRPVCGGIVLGIFMGVLYCFSMWYFAPAVGGGGLALARARDAALASSFNLPQFAGDDNGNNKDDNKARRAATEQQLVHWVMSLWESGPALGLRAADAAEARRRLPPNLLQAAGPHLQDCAAAAVEQARADERDATGRRPAWALWKGELGRLERPVRPVETEEEPVAEEFLGDRARLVWGPYPPWVEGADEDNLPMTRRAQRDLWLLQHPKNCSAPDVRFLVSSWTNNPVHGFGAQIHHMQGMFVVALTDKRVLVTHDFAFGDHDGCQGSDRKRWSCYFVPETTPECRRKAYELMHDAQALATGRVLLDRQIPPHWDIWMGQPTELWGKPWEHVQPTTEIEGKLLVQHKTANVRWWRAQAIRYLMRYPSQYTCLLMNRARHEAFGVQVATNVVRAAMLAWDKSVVEADMEKWVWKSHKPWVPRPLVSVHVRIGDKGGEMKLVGFSAYMRLAERLRKRFPHVRDVWLSTEMQEVIDASKQYQGWNFYYTNISRQTGSTTMAAYLKSLGPQTSTAMSVVNFLMASDADFFVGALGSTWCYLIDGMRSTGGKHSAGYLSVNIDRHWR